MSYEKQGFASGDVLYATQLNAMDDQIADNEEEITGLKSATNNASVNIGELGENLITEELELTLSYADRAIRKNGVYLDADSNYNVYTGSVKDYVGKQIVIVANSVIDKYQQAVFVDWRGISSGTIKVADFVDIVPPAPEGQKNPSIYVTVKDGDSVKVYIITSTVKNAIASLQSEIENEIDGINDNIGTVPSNKTIQGQIDEVNTKLGAVSLPTTAQTITGAIAEHEVDINGIKNNIGTVPYGKTVQSQITDLQNEFVDIGEVPSGKTVQGQIDDINDEIGNGSLPTIAQTIIDAISEHETDIVNIGTHKVNKPLDQYNQPTDGENGQFLRTKGNGSTEWVNTGLPTDEQTEQAVSDWLNSHPEATTTVIDGSITESKFSNVLKNKAIKDYVTPEMYGAAGDGETDDTEAIRMAINNGSTVCMFNSYIITESIVIDKIVNIYCYGEIEYTGDSSAIIITRSDVNVYIRELRTNKNGIEMRPVYNSTSCTIDIIECGRIKCIGSNGIGLYLNCNDYHTQFCKFIINRLQGGDSIDSMSNVGIKIVGKAQSNKYCNGNIFDIHSICFFDTGILVDAVPNSCIENVFTNVHFEANNVAMNMGNSRFDMNAEFSEGNGGTIKIKNGMFCTLKIDGYLHDTRLDLTELADITTGYIALRGRILNNTGIYLTDNITITQLGIFSQNATTPFVSTVLTNALGSNIVKYISNGDSIDLPAIRKGNSGEGYVLEKIQLFFSILSGSSGSFGINFSDGNTVIINYTSNRGIVSIVPSPLNNNQWVFYQPI